MPGQRILVFGASGNSGKWIMKNALEKIDGPKIIAFVRSEDKLRKVMTSTPVNLGPAEYDTAVRDGKLVIVTGELLDVEKVENAVALLSPGDAVICVAGKPLGCKDKEPLTPPFLRNALIPAMRRQNVKRLVYQAGAMSAAAGWWKYPGQFFSKLTIAPVIGATGMVEDNDKVGPYLKRECKDIEWIFSRPGALTDRVSAGKKVVVSFMANMQPIKFADLADWTLDAVWNDNLLERSPFVAYSLC